MAKRGAKVKEVLYRNTQMNYSTRLKKEGTTPEKVEDAKKAAGSNKGLQ